MSHLFHLLLCSFSDSYLVLLSRDVFSCHVTSVVTWHLTSLYKTDSINWGMAYFQLYFSLLLLLGITTPWKLKLGSKRGCVRLILTWYEQTLWKYSPNCNYLVLGQFTYQNRGGSRDHTFKWKPQIKLQMIIVNLYFIPIECLLHHRLFCVCVCWTVSVLGIQCLVSSATILLPLTIH